MLIDSPGMRELQLWGDEQSLAGAFEEIEAAAEACRFRDCRHQGEPGCAVQQALAEGALDQARFENYLGMQKELAFLASRRDEKARRAFRNRGKQIAKFSRARKKLNGR